MNPGAGRMPALREAEGAAEEDHDGEVGEEVDAQPGEVEGGVGGDGGEECLEGGGFGVDELEGF